MTKPVYLSALAIVASLAAAPLFAEGLAFEAVAPEGLDATATKMVEQLHIGMPALMPQFQAQGYGAYGAVAVPMGVVLGPQSLSSVANFDDRGAARDGVLDACKTQTSHDCTVVGYLVPAGG